MNFDSLKSWVGMEQEPRPPPTFVEQVQASFQFSYTTRIVVFGVTLLLGLCCCFIVGHPDNFPMGSSKFLIDFVGGHLCVYAPRICQMVHVGFDFVDY